MTRLSLSVGTALVLTASTVWAGPFEDATAANTRGDYATVFRTFQSLAAQGNEEAQTNLGMLYANGQGVPQDYAQARQWFEKAATHGHARAQVNLGLLYANGQGVTQDYKTAEYWFRRSAIQGNAMALTKLGLMYERGNGVTQDFIQAHKWYILGAAHGDSLGAEFRDALAERMTPAQLFQAQELARKWTSKPQ
jgi:hypothetical protein